MSTIHVPDGYVIQYLDAGSTSGSGPGYISKDVLKTWLHENREETGSRFQIKVSDETLIIAVKRKLTEDEIDELRRITNPEAYESSNAYVTEETR